MASGQEFGLPINCHIAMDSEGMPCTLHWAVPRGHTELAGHLLDQVGKAAVDVADDDGWTPLIIAASAGHSQLVNMLLDNGADVNKTTSQGRSDPSTLYHTGHIAPYFRGLPPIRFFFGKNA